MDGNSRRRRSRWNYTADVEQVVRPGAISSKPREPPSLGGSISPANQHAHHDALEFPDGEIVLLTHLMEGRRRPPQLGGIGPVCLGVGGIWAGAEFDEGG
jgi:hypothetical protein